MAGAPEENTNAEKWTEEEAKSFLERAIQVTKDNGFDFIGETASKMDSYREIFVYLRDKSNECKRLYKRLLQECESNCFSHAKKGDIVPSLGIINLKSNHGWTDRVDQTSKGDSLKSESIPLVLQNGKTYDDLKNELKPE